MWGALPLIISTFTNQCCSYPLLAVAITKHLIVTARMFVRRYARKNDCVFIGEGNIYSRISSLGYSATWAFENCTEIKNKRFIWKLERHITQPWRHMEKQHSHGSTVTTLLHSGALRENQDLAGETINSSVPVSLRLREFKREHQVVNLCTCTCIALRQRSSRHQLFKEAKNRPVRCSYSNQRPASNLGKWFETVTSDS